VLGTLRAGFTNIDYVGLCLGPQDPR